MNNIYETHCSFCGRQRDNYYTSVALDSRQSAAKPEDHSTQDLTIQTWSPSPDNDGMEMLLASTSDNQPEQFISANPATGSSDEAPTSNDLLTSESEDVGTQDLGIQTTFTFDEVSTL